MKRVPFKKYKHLLARKNLRVRGISDSSILKEEIQALLREISIIRDGGCVFRKYPESGVCGGFRKDGKLILQFDHLNSRTHAISFSNPDLGICVCKRHHIFWKKQYSAQYEAIARKIIGIKRCKILDAVRADRHAYKIDLKLAKLALEQELFILNGTKKT